ncbi:Gfo/Idh/MocA family oxidoreductase [Abyssibius alkaniclasticus]|uniref:Gfo/Idh/MocA family oxidoreductase n=1 Tax=Abyssibius alkaniclasticus TaxID=2881234 RepID=UPI00236493AD|nr:Gfo/Idh/MocA family oxidoreductase [Abyssibius alkaniclasticus]UPH70274.1 Gfo/Idh/MocA family oxidoreductase [Abyssibius alkaniclasticus]
MTSKRTRLQEDTHFRVIRLLQENPEMSQRDLAAAVGVSVGGILLNYPRAAEGEEAALERVVMLDAARPKASKGSVAFLGAGNYASRMLIPAFRAAGADLDTVISSGGISAVHSGKKFGFREAATEATDALTNTDIDTMVIATRHDAHAKQVLEALRAGKHVFCEKPLCLTLDELAEIEAEKATRPEQHLMIGFNRRFAPHIIQMKGLLNKIDQPKTFIMTINAGDIPADHWAQNPAVGGGRIVGECCHFIDLLRHLAGAPIVAHHAVSLGEHTAIAIREDKAVITLQFADGSVGAVNYLANGHPSVAKERLEVFVAGRVLQLDNFRRLTARGWSKVRPVRLWKQDKGQVACATAFIEAVRSGKPAPVSAAELFEVSRVSIEVAESLR